MTDCQELENLKFVQFVKKYPCIYDPTSKDYQQKFMARKAWSKVAAEFKTSVKKCKERWKNIRTCFGRYLKRKISDPENFSKDYYLSDALQFLVPVYLKNCKHSPDLKLPLCDTDHIQHDFEIGDEQMYEIQDQDSDTNTEQFDNKLSSACDSEKILEAANWKLQDNTRQTFKSEIPEEDTNESYKRPLLHYVQKRVLNEGEKTDDSMGEHMDSTTKINSSESLSVDEQFLLSLKDDMKEMDSRQKRLFKKGVYDLIGQILDGTQNPCNQYVLAITPSTPISSVNNIVQTTSNSNFRF